jgi:hypothetical protein
MYELHIVTDFVTYINSVTSGFIPSVPSLIKVFKVKKRERLYWFHVWKAAAQALLLLDQLPKKIRHC